MFVNGDATNNGNPIDPTSYVVQEDVFTLPGLAGQRDVLYFFADSQQSPGDRALFEMRMSGFFGSGSSFQPEFLIHEKLVVADPGDDLTISGDRLFYTATFSGHRQLAMINDPDNSDTAVTISTNASGDSDPRDLTDVDGILYFTALDDGGVRRLYRVSGSTATLVSPDVSDPSELSQVGGELSFIADDRLWFSDGSPAGTYALDSIQPPVTSIRTTVAETGDTFDSTIGNEEVLQLDISQAIRDALAAGKDEHHAPDRKPWHRLRRYADCGGRQRNRHGRHRPGD